MATSFPTAPTYAEPVIADEVTGKPRFNPIWLRWFLQIQSFITASGGGAGGAPSHETLTDLQGGTANEHYHFTAPEHTALAAGFTGTGALVRETTPTLVTPVIGAATGTSLSVTGRLTGGDVTALVASSAAMNNGAAAAAGTLLNAPVAGNPTKWIPIDDNGTTRYVPCW